MEEVFFRHLKRDVVLICIRQEVVWSCICHRICILCRRATKM